MSSSPALHLSRNLDRLILGPREHEVEVKMRILGHSAVRARLKKLGGAFIGRYFERNAFFDTPDGSLLADDKGLRLRTKYDSQSKSSTHILSFKGSRRGEHLNRRGEIETQVASRDATIHLLDQLGYNLTLVFDKRRESWKLDGCRVELDEVPMLGTFVEIDGPDESSVMSVRDKLGMTTFRMTSESYVDILLAHLKKNHSRRRIITFESKVIRT